MEVLNDNSCSWINDLSPRNNILTLSSDIDCEWLIIGAGYTGLSAARKLGQLYPNQKILSPLNKLWIKLGEILGRVIAPIVMAIIYFLILTPISLLVRLFGKDLIGMKYKNDVESYWVIRKKHLGSMDKQF